MNNRIVFHIYGFFHVVHRMLHTTGCILHKRIPSFRNYSATVRISPLLPVVAVEFSAVASVH